MEMQLEMLEQEGREKDDLLLGSLMDNHDNHPKPSILNPRP